MAESSDNTAGSRPPGSAPNGSPSLVLGPLLRFVNDSSATVWVETDRPCTVEVLGVSEPTWTVHDHHYALIVITGLEPGTTTSYQVDLDGTQVWPPAGSTFPASVIRTFSHTDSFRLSFGSCRRSAGDGPDDLKRFGADALTAMAYAMVMNPHDLWPDALFLGGDQVYADEPSPDQRRRLLAQHGVDDVKKLDKHDPMTEVADEIQNFEEYTWLYHDTWNRPAVRWLLSTVPTVMLLDDHDLRDDWNTSKAWRDRVTATPWWRERVLGAYASYWVYQHLGNLSPDELARDELFAMVRTVDDDEERTRRLDEFALLADNDPTTVRWSFYRDFGNEELGIRLVAVDSRCSRVLESGARAMLDEQEWQWFTEHADPDDGTRIDHLLIGATLPIFMVRGIHHLEGWNEALAESTRRPPARFAEWLRQTVDLEHWCAFRRTFDAMMVLFASVGGRAEPPASILVLSGDVHCSYVSKVSLDGVDPTRTGFFQLTMSPFRNPLEPPIRLANHLLNQRWARRLMRALARRQGVEDGAAQWDITHGLWFDNGVMTVVIHGRTAMVEVDHAQVRDGKQVLERTRTARLTPPGSVV